MKKKKPADAEAMAWRGKLNKDKILVSAEMTDNRKGQALIEAITAIGVVIVGVLGALAFLSSSIGYNRTVTNQYTATYLAGGIIEEVKNCIDVEGWDTDCKALLLVEGKLGEESVNETTFEKVLEIKSLPVGDEIYKQVVVKVSWSERGDDFEINIEDRFYNWR